MKSLFQTGILGINHAMITKFLKSFDNSQKRTKRSKTNKQKWKYRNKNKWKNKISYNSKQYCKIFFKKVLILQMKALTILLSCPDSENILQLSLELSESWVYEENGFVTLNLLNEYIFSKVFDSLFILSKLFRVRLLIGDLP